MGNRLYVGNLSFQSTTDSVRNETYGPMVDAIDQLLQAGRKTGAIRSTLGAEDLLLLVGFLWRSPPGAEGKAQADRLLGIVLASLETGA